MNDPHVTKVTYKLNPSEEMKFSNPTAIKGDEPEFSYSLNASAFIAQMKAHFPTTEAACNAVEPFLKAWELDLAIKHGARQLTFDFENAEIVDRQPSTRRLGEPIEVRVEDALMFIQSAEAQVVRTYHEYPSPPTRFKASDSVQNMWFRYEQYRSGREPLLSMAYVCLTTIEGSTALKNGARDAAAAKYSIDRAILKQMGELVSTKGGPREARKLDASATGVPLSEQERRWIEAAVRMLIRRKAEVDADPVAPLKQITLADIQ